MAEQAQPGRRPDGWSISTPAIWPFIPGFGRTSYSNPGSPTAPEITWTLKRGAGGGGLHAVFLRDGMTSQDTLGGGVTLNAGSGVNAAVNASVPDLRHPWNMNVSSIGAGVGLPGLALSSTFTPQQFFDFLRKQISIAEGRSGSGEFVRNSAAAAGVPSRNNVVEYGFPEPGQGRSNVFNTGAPPVPYVSSPQQRVGGLPGLLATVAGTDPLNPTQPAPPAGGLLGLMQDYMRNNPDGGTR